MASGDRRIPTWAKEELVHLTNKCDNLKLGDLKSRLKSLLESVEAEERYDLFLCGGQCPL